MGLRERFVELLSQKPKSVIDLPAVIPDEIGRGVLRWGSPKGPWHMLFHVRDQAIVTWNVATAPMGAPRVELTDEQAEQYTSFLSGISVAELATADRPLVFVPRAVVSPLDGFAVAHPSLALHRIHDDEEWAKSLTFVAFPCFASEIPEPVDHDWARLQFRDVTWSNVARRPTSAFRSGKAPPPAKGKKVPKHHRKPTRPRDLAGLISAYGPRKAGVEIENWRGHVLRIEAGKVAIDDQRVPIAGRDHLRALVTEFVEQDRSSVTPGASDAFPPGEAWSLLEATVGDVDDGVEPVAIEERVTGHVVARLWVRTMERTLDVAFAIEDPRVTRDVLDVALTDAYLRVLTRHHHRGKVDVLRMYPKASPSEIRELPYPAK